MLHCSKSIRENLYLIFSILSFFLAISAAKANDQIMSQNCATFDISSQIIHVPCLGIEQSYYWIDLKLSSWEAQYPCFELMSFGNSINDTNCAIFNPSSAILHIPCLRLVNSFYWVDLRLQYTTPLILEVTDLDVSNKRPSKMKPIVLMSYNILNGAGVDELFEPNKEWAANHGYPGNRLPQVLEIIHSVNPDILAIQEAHQWERGDPPVIKRVADQLGMNYFLGESENPDSGFAHVALLTRYHILDAESYPNNFTRAALRCRIVLPNGQFLNIFVAHLDSTSSQIRQGEVTFIVQKMQSYFNDLSIIMGDMNFFDGWSNEGKILHKGGWHHSIGSSIDQIWTSSMLAPYIQDASDKIPYNLTIGASDHVPVVGIITLP